ncbi:hypothetical protein Tco_0069319, partial [Tanacetum coccineum]
AFGKVYDEVYREELCKVEELIRDRRRVEAELFFESGQELTEAIRKTWTDEMLDIYRACVDEKVAYLQASINEVRAFEIPKEVQSAGVPA